MRILIGALILAGCSAIPIKMPEPNDNWLVYEVEYKSGEILPRWKKDGIEPRRYSSMDSAYWATDQLRQMHPNSLIIMQWQPNWNRIPQ